MKTIPLSQGKCALVDDADYDWLMQWKWYAHKAPRTFYAVRNTQQNEGRRRMVYMHREIMGLIQGDVTQVDHKSRQGLDNQRSNLRQCTTVQNGANRKKQSTQSLSKYKGVSKYPNSHHKKPWAAAIKYHGKHIYIGMYADEDEAARAYDEKAKELFGDFARLNNV